MAVTIIKQGTEDNAYRWEYYCDAPADMSNINSDNITLGSYCMVLNGTDGIDTYIADSNKNWVLVHPTVNKQITAEEEGKIVVNGNFVSQTARPNIIISNDTYDTTQYNSVTVNVQPPLQSKTIITNGTVTPDSNYYGFSEVIVNVPTGGNGSNLILTEKTITSNGIYDPLDNDAHGYNSVIVNVPNTYTTEDEGKVVSNGELISTSLYLINPNVLSTINNAANATYKIFAPYVAKIKNDASYPWTWSGNYLYRSGYQVGCIKLAQLIEANKYSKLFVDVSITQYTTNNWRQGLLQLCSSLNVTTDGQNQNVLKTIYLATQDLTSEQINNQSNVIINSTSPYTLTRQVVEIDISDINTDFYVCFMNCDVNIYIYEIYLT